MPVNIRRDGPVMAHSYGGILHSMSTDCGRRQQYRGLSQRLSKSSWTDEHTRVYTCGAKRLAPVKVNLVAILGGVR